MTEPNLLVICAAAFLAVMIMLAILAGIFAVLPMLFPDERRGPDEAVVAAIHTAVRAAYPGTRITNIEEVR